MAICMSLWKNVSSDPLLIFKSGFLLLLLLSCMSSLYSLYVCVCVCWCVSVCVSVSKCVCMCWCGWVWVCEYACVGVCACVCVHVLVWVWVCECECVSVSVCVRVYMSFMYGTVVKITSASAGDMGSIPELGRFPWRRKWQPAPALLPGEPHGQRSLMDSWLTTSKGCKSNDMSEPEHALL